MTVALTCEDGDSYFVTPSFFFKEKERKKNQLPYFCFLHFHNLKTEGILISTASIKKQWIISENKESVMTCILFISAKL